jgi:hypothetical protein
MTSDPSDEDFFRIWTTDSSGNRVMRGLTKEETEEYRALQERFLQSRRSDEFPWPSVADRSRDLTRKIELHDKHEIARIGAVAAESELRTDKPTIN